MSWYFLFIIAHNRYKRVPSWKATKPSLTDELRNMLANPPAATVMVLPVHEFPTFVPVAISQ